MATLRAGVAQVCITPPIGVELSGYGFYLNRRSESVHDDLYAEALVLDDGDTRVAIVTSDLLAVDEAFVADVRARAAQDAGIEPDHIMVSAIHSHTAPTACFLRGCGKRDEEYISILARYVAGAIASAARQLRPARIGYGQGEHRELAWYRLNDGGGTIDSTVRVLRVDDAASGDPVAILTNYACHPVMLGPKATISADYPGALRRYVEGMFPGCIHMFANGPCGDIDPVSNRDAWGQATFDDVDRAGQALGVVVAKAAMATQTQAEANLQCAQVSVGLPLDTMTLEEAQAKLSKRQDALRTATADPNAVEADVKLARFGVDWAQDVVETIQAGKAQSERPAELEAMRIGDGVLVALPGEIFTEVGMAARAKSRWPHRLLASCANGDVGYIPVERDFEHAGYASSVAPALYDRFRFKSDMGSVLVAGVERLLQQLD